VWVSVRPGLRRIHGLTGDILTALGKRSDIAGKGRNQSQDNSLAVAWLRAHHTPDLVIVDAQHLHPKILSGLRRLAEQAQTRLWLLHRAPSSDAFAAWLHRNAPTKVAIHEVPRFSATSPVASGCPQRLDLPALPRTDFHLFLDRCRTRISADDYQRVSGRFAAQTATAANAMRGATDLHATATDLIDTLLRQAPTDDQLICDLRAIQVAAWHHDLYIRVDLTTLLHSQERPHRNIADIDTALLAYRQPQRILVPALTARGHALEPIAALTLADAGVDGTLTIDSKPVADSPALKAAVRAARHHRLDERASPDDPLIPYAPKAMSHMITQAREDLGLHVHGRRAERYLHPRQWLNKLGITLEDLT
jgi:hypothetical protein